MTELRWMELSVIGYVILVVLGLLPHNLVLGIVAVGFLLTSIFVKF